jgi:[calcium/calmodulin-dependent protein kinase] kinase
MRNLLVLVCEPSDQRLPDANLAKMKAVKKFKGLLDKKRPSAISGTLGQGIRTLHTSYGADATSEPALHKSRSVDMHDRRNVETALAAEGVHHDIDGPEFKGSKQSMTNRMDSSSTVIYAPIREDSQDQPHHRGKKADPEELPQRPELHSDSSGEKGHAHDPLEGPPLFLGIGIGGKDSLDVPEQKAVAESPTAAEFNIYDTAYQGEVERIRSAQGRKATVYLTRRVDSKKEYKADENMVDAPKQSQVEGMPHEGWKGLLDRAREKSAEQPLAEDKVGGTSHTFSTIAAMAVENTKAMGKGLGDRGVVALGNVMHMAMEKRKEIADKRDEWREEGRKKEFMNDA